MNKVITVALIILSINKILSQKVFEFNKNYKVKFTVYNNENNKINKLIKESDFSLETPEKTAQAFFFAFNNEWLAKLYLNKKNTLVRDNSHYTNVKKTKFNDIHIQLLHKMEYEYKGNQACYLMFIVKIKDVPFYFPTLIPLTQINNEWKIDLKANQNKLTQCLSMFKPCVLSNLIEGKSSNLKIQKLIAKTKNYKGHIDFNKLYDEFRLITENKNKADSEELTMSDNLNCNDIIFNDKINSTVNFSALFEKVNISKNFNKNEKEQLINSLKIGNDSISLKEKLSIKHDKKVFELVKYETFNNNLKSNKVKRIDNNDPNFVPIKHLITLYENLDTKIFNNLTPSIDSKIREKQEKNILFRETRGTINILNITKLYNLYQKDKNLFKEYIYK